MIKVLSFAWFRSKASVYEGIKGNSAIQFEQFLPLLLKTAPIVWPGWKVVLHIDDEIQQRPCFRELEKRANRGEVRLVRMARPSSIGIGCLWRLRPVLDLATDYVAMRDIDTIPTPKDSHATEEFIVSGFTAHAMHDNPAHSGLMTGMIAFNATEFRLMTGWRTWAEFVEFCQTVYTPAEWDTQGSEQRFLNEFVLPKVKDSLFHHALGAELRDLGAATVRRTAPVDPLLPAVRLSPGIGVCDDPAKANAFYGVEDWACRG